MTTPPLAFLVFSMRIGLHITRCQRCRVAHISPIFKRLKILSNPGKYKHLLRNDKGFCIFRRARSKYSSAETFSEAAKGDFISFATLPRECTEYQTTLGHSSRHASEPFTRTAAEHTETRGERKLLGMIFMQFFTMLRENVVKMTL